MLSIDINNIHFLQTCAPVWEINCMVSLAVGPRIKLENPEIHRLTELRKKRAYKQGVSRGDGLPSITGPFYRSRAALLSF